ncbi:MAG: hypothetical protein ACD_73C00216G0001 [uncultured bacterium]|nr:MAG: hypothetical protein ACD_73C00216G0001 [uncultured bacterium]
MDTGTSFVCNEALMIVQARPNSFSSSSLTRPLFLSPATSSAKYPDPLF